MFDMAKKIEIDISFTCAKPASEYSGAGFVLNSAYNN